MRWAVAPDRCGYRYVNKALYNVYQWQSQYLLDYPTLEVGSHIEGDSIWEMCGYEIEEWYDRLGEGEDDE